MNDITTTAWQQYEAGKEYKRRIGLYETVRKNERFYRGDQWYRNDSDLPRPIFNLVRRIADHLVGSVLPNTLSIHYSDEHLPFIEDPTCRQAVENGLRLLEQNAAYRWKQHHLNAVAHQALLNAAISGDGIFYCWWDSEKNDGQPFRGDIRTDCVENTNLFVADVNLADIQSQDYIILSGRATVQSLRKEALAFGCSEKEISLIVGDSEHEAIASDRSVIDMEGAEKTTYLIRFYRENGKVIYEKSTEKCLICRIETGLHHYPVAYFNWRTAKNSFHGSAPISDMIANQVYINTAYAMVMKHMRDTAFSKIVYDQSRIPEWSNEVGEAIAAMGGGTVSDAVAVIGVGKMQDGYLELLENVIENTKAMMGATEAALGDERANNTSAILVLQEASLLSLTQVSSNFCRCIGELATIWADMLCTYCPTDRLLPIETDDGIRASRINHSLLKKELLRASVEIGTGTAYTPASTVTLLDKLLDRGDLNIREYLELLPPGCISNRERLLQTIQTKGGLNNE